jgi:3-hydroxyisobutyrate dehydrogenase
VSAILKDLHYTQDLARCLGRPLFTGSIAKELFAMTVAGGFEGEDLSSVYKVLR